MSKNYEILSTYPYPLGAFLEKDGVRFAGRFPENAQGGVIIYPKDGTPCIRIPFPNDCKIGQICAMKIKDLQKESFGYTFFADNCEFQDPFMRDGDLFRAWGEPGINRALPVEIEQKEERISFTVKSHGESIYYLLHVRGFTMHKSSGVRHKGTFQGVIEKLPYLKKDLGITTLVLMPCYDFEECIGTLAIDDGSMEYAVHNFDQIPVNYTSKNGQVSLEQPVKLNYWGYTGKASYMLPKPAYCGTENPNKAFAALVKACHEQGLELILQFYFENTMTETDIREILAYWKYRFDVDGFWLVGGGLPLTQIAQEPVLASCKLMHDDFADDQHQRAQVVKVDQDYLFAIRKFLKGDSDTIGGVTHHMKSISAKGGKLHYLAKWDTMRLADFVSYNEKHNDDNGEENRDGTDYNCSWNCGYEGASRRKSVMALRDKQLKNALFMLLLAPGSPMIQAGDEFGNTQYGNNNPYCQDNEISWVKWTHTKQGDAMLGLFKELIHIRNAYPCFAPDKPFKAVDVYGCGYPDISIHGEEAWKPSRRSVDHAMGILYCIEGSKKKDPNLVYFAMNMHWEPAKLALPKPPKGMQYKVILSTENAEKIPVDEYVELPPRTVALLVTTHE